MKASMQAARLFALCAVTLLAAVGTVHAVQPLQGRDINGNPVAADAATAVMEYDPNLNITWLRDWNQNGVMDWSTANTWASSLRVGIFGGWSLPTALNQDGTGPCSGYNCTSSPIGYMYYTELGNVSFSGMSNKGPFQNVQSFNYWLGTKYQGSVVASWKFMTRDGWQDISDNTLKLNAVAVRPGDVASAVPEAQTWALMLAGLGAVTVALKRQHL